MTGGIGVHFEAIAASLASRGHDITVVTSADVSGHSVHKACSVHTVAEDPATTTIYRFDTSWHMRASECAKGLGPFDLFFAAEWGGDAYDLAGGNTPLITYLATSLEQILRMSPSVDIALLDEQSRIQLERERLQAEHSNGILAVSHAMLRSARSLWNIDHIPSRVIPNFIDLERVSRLAQGKVLDAFPTDVETVLYFGSLNEKKGTPVLARSMQKVFEVHPGVHFVFIGGDGPFGSGKMSDYVKGCNASHAEQIHFLPTQQPETLMPCVAAATVVVVPSLWEAFGLVALESRALRRPTIATSGSGFDDFFTDGRNGLLVPPGDHDALAQALNRVLDDRELARSLGENGGNDATRFSPEWVAPQIEKWFESVMSAGLILS